MNRHFLTAFVLTLIVFIAGIDAVRADDLARLSTAFNWSGFYVGAHAGWGWNTSTVNDPFSVSGVLNGGVATSNEPVRDVKGGGFFGGGQAGWNYQVGQFVIGPELSVSSGVGASRTDFIGGSRIVNPNSMFTFLGTVVDSRTWKTDLDWLAMATGRIGYARDRWLIYAKGGAAVAQARYALRDQANSAAAAAPPLPATPFETLSSTGVFTGSETRVGWTLGAGLEWAFWSGWSALAEYDYVSLGERSVTVAGSTASLFTQPASFGPPAIIGPTPGAITIPMANHFQMVRFGVNYHFNMEPVGVIAKY